MKQQKQLKPIVTNATKYKHNSKQNVQQVVLLKALEVTSDPKKLKEIMGVKTVAEVYRTLDKLSIRKEYHDALARAGFSLDKVVTGIAHIAENSEKDDTRLKAYQVLMKSVGLDKYEADTTAGGTWEEELIKSIENNEENNSLPEAIKEYEVTEPEMPEKMKKLREEEEELTKSIYGG